MIKKLYSLETPTFYNRLQFFKSSCGFNMLSVHLLVFSVFFVLSNGSVSMHNPFYCYSQDPIRPQTGMFSTTTSYETNRGRNIDPSVSNCVPSKFWMLSRHGTRLPNITELTIMFEHNERLQRDILRNYDSGRASLCASDVELIRNWKFDSNITFENEQHLTVTGWNEFQGLAERYQSAFPSILPSTYSRDDYFFRATDFQRTIASLHAFADGFFGFNGHQQVQIELFDGPDVLLRPYLNCDVWDKVVANRTERNAFLEGPEYQEMIAEVSHKLGFHGSYTLTAGEVEALILTCRYEQIRDKDSASPLCAAFSIANHQVLEYSEDLIYYGRSGYAHPNYRRLFENLSCQIMQDMLHFLQSNDPNDHKARIFNAHLSILQLMLVTFGAFEDDVQLTRHNFAQQTFRLWKTSVFCPMGANLAVIRYE